MVTRYVLFGGTGFFGRVLAQELVARGCTVVTASRRTAVDIKRDRGDAGAGRLGQDHSHRVVDITRPATLSDVVRAGDTVVHLAARSPLHRPVGGRAAYRRLHVDGTRHVVNAALNAGASRVVYVSALGVHRRCGSAYGETKAKASAIVRRAPIASMIVAPSIFFGPGSEVSHALSLVGRVPIVPLPRLDARFRPVHVQDGARLLVDALLAPTPPVYLELTGPEDLSMFDVAGLAVRAYGGRILPIPRGPARLMVSLVSALRLPGFPTELNALLAMDNAGTAPTDGEGMIRYSHWVRRRTQERRRRR